MSVLDNYLAGLTAPERAAYERVRDLAIEVVPEVEVGTSYGMPAPADALRDLVRHRADEIRAEAP